MCVQRLPCLRSAHEWCALYLHYRCRFSGAIFPLVCVARQRPNVGFGPGGQASLPILRAHCAVQRPPFLSAGPVGGRTRAASPRKEAQEGQVVVALRPMVQAGVSSFPCLAPLRTPPELHRHGRGNVQGPRVSCHSLTSRGVGDAQGSIRRAVHRRRTGANPPWTPPPSKTKVTIVGGNGIYHWKTLLSFSACSHCASCTLRSLRAWHFPTA